MPGTPAERQSYNDLSLDADGVLRRDLVHVTGQDEVIMSKPMRVMEVATGDRSIRGSIDAGTDDDAWLAADAGGYHNEIEAGLGLQRMLLYRQPGSYRRYTLEQWLENSISLMPSAIRSCGSAAQPPLRDLFEVPFSRFHSGVEMFQLPGLEIHANRIATLLDSRSNSAALIWTMPGWGNRLLLVVSLLAGLRWGKPFQPCAAACRPSQPWLRWSRRLAGAVLVPGLGWHRPAPDRPAEHGGCRLAAAGAVSQQHSQQIRRLLGQATTRGGSTALGSTGGAAEQWPL